MGRTKATASAEPKRRNRPALSPEARENQMIALAVDRAEQQLMDGTASPSVIVHYLKLGSMRDRIEKERLEEEVKLLKAKTEALQSQKQIQELYADALTAMRDYQGISTSIEDDENI